MTPWLLLLIPSPAHAASVVDYSENFDSYTTSSFSGTGGWVSGTSSDPWSAATGDGVYATTDENGGTYGSGGYADNHLRYNSKSWSDFTMDVVIQSTDDDAIGVVFRYKDAQNYYLAFWSRNYMPGTGTGAATTTTGSAHLYRVSAGSATQIASYTTSYTSSVDYDLRVEAKGSSLKVWFDLDRDGAWDTGEDILKATDTTHTSGMVGFYCYDNGNAAAGGCVFDDVEVSLDDTDADGVPDLTDNCDSAANPTQTDTDGDGTGDACDSDADGDGYTSGADCNDLSSAVKPGATEVCDGVDQDCDATIDDGTSCYDDDGDGWTEAGGDCNDASSAISPAASETCNGVDQDCDGTIDDNPIDGTLWYTDGDSDGYGGSGAGYGCTAPSGAVSTSGDCADSDATAHPGGTETCDGVDDDCDGTADDSATDASTWYDDDDSDGYGDASSSTEACTAPAGTVADATDCDDAAPGTHPDAAETCDGEDEDCDGVADDDPIGLPTWYFDGDEDGFGDPTTSADACDAPPGYLADDSDCDDTVAGVNPDATEIPGNGIDEDCDGEDGVPDTDTGGGDTDTGGGDTDTGGGDTDTGGGDTDTGADTDTDPGGDTDAGDSDAPVPTSTRAWDPPADTGGEGAAGAGCGCASPGSGVPAALGWVTILLVARRRRGER